MLAYILSGTLFGLTAGISPGPLLVLVISETMTYGTRAGVKTALAPLITDTPIIILTLLILDRVKSFHFMFGIISLLGAGYILYLAYGGWMSGRIDPEEVKAPSNGLLKGFYTNMLSPHPYLFWFTVGSPIIIKASRQSFATAAMFILFFYIFILGSKISIAVIAGNYRKNFNIYYSAIQKVLAIVLVMFSLLFFYEGLRYMNFLRFFY